MPSSSPPHFGLEIIWMPEDIPERAKSLSSEYLTRFWPRVHANAVWLSSTQRKNVRAESDCFLSLCELPQSGLRRSRELYPAAPENLPSANLLFQSRRADARLRFPAESASLFFC